MNHKGTMTRAEFDEAVAKFEREDLIAEARRLIANCATYNFGMYEADKLAHEVAGKLADALEGGKA
jgi:hypothetical protein